MSTCSECQPGARLRAVAFTSRLAICCEGRWMIAQDITWIVINNSLPTRHVKYRTHVVSRAVALANEIALLPGFHLAVDRRLPRVEHAATAVGVAAAHGHEPVERASHGHVPHRLDHRHEVGIAAGVVRL